MKTSSLWMTAAVCFIAPTSVAQARSAYDGSCEERLRSHLTIDVSDAENGAAAREVRSAGATGSRNAIDPI